ncbi:MAG: hypothetical protein KF798_02805 [Candidatus Paracaedibacteraceae bacterium]|nr:hypothetical protein [Candidatus Paracaedibacteraceae bacterium]
MKYFVWSSVISFLLVSSPVKSQDSEHDVYMRMIGQAIVSTMEEHHAYDWKEITDTASRFWKDPSSALDQETRRLQGKFYRFVFKTFLGDQASVTKIMKRYFEYQLDCLVADYEKAPASRYQFWSKVPSHYHAILAFELLAVESGIKLDHSYHDIFSLVSDKARMIEDASQKISSDAVVTRGVPPAPPPPPLSSVSMIPIAPQSPSLKLTHPTKDRPQRQKRHAPVTVDALSATQNSLKKTITKESSLSENVLNEIKQGGFTLKPASKRILRDRPAESEDNDLLTILKKRFNQIRPALSESD